MDLFQGCILDRLQTVWHQRHPSLRIVHMKSSIEVPCSAASPKIAKFGQLMAAHLFKWQILLIACG